MTPEFGGALQLQHNDRKSVRSATRPSVRRALRRAPGLPMVTTFWDLGVEQRVSGRRRRGVLEERVAAIRQRYSRVGRLALPWRVRAPVAGASAVFGAAGAI